MDTTLTQLTKSVIDAILNVKSVQIILSAPNVLIKRIPFPNVIKLLFALEEHMLMMRETANNAILLVQLALDQLTLNAIHAQARQLFLMVNV